jgi:aromatic ring hydroxylase-like protein
MVASEAASRIVSPTQIRVTYRGTDWVRDDAAGLDPAVPGAGDRAPDAGGLRRHGVGFPLRLFDVLRGTEHVLIAHLPNAGAPAETTELAAFAAQLGAHVGDRVRVAVIAAAQGVPEQPSVAVYYDEHGEFTAAYGAQATSFLVRPDGYIGWRGRSWDDKGLFAYLAKTLDGARRS